MKITYDSEVDALAISFREATVTTRELADGITGEFDQEGRLAGIEILDLVRRFGDAETLRQVVVEGVGPATAMARERPDKPYGKT